MTAAQDRRIEELEAELVRARVQNSYLASELAAQPANHSMVREVVAHNPDVPTECELKLLFEVASKRWPRITPSHNPQHAFARFTAAFAYLSQGCSYSDRRSNLAPGNWCDKADQWLKAHRYSYALCETSWGAIALAASTLNFQHSDYNGEPAYSWSIWLSEGAWRSPPSSTWRAVLAGEPLHAPVRVDRPRAPEAPITRITGGNAAVGMGPRNPDLW